MIRDIDRIEVNKMWLRTARQSLFQGKYTRNARYGSIQVTSMWRSSNSTKDNARKLLFFSAGLSAMTLVSHCSSENDQKTKNAKEWKVYSRDEVKQHNSIEKRVWVTYLDSVYDITDFLMNHPGDKDRLLTVAGQDIGSSWNLFVHHKSSPLVHELLAEMKIGILASKDIVELPSSSPLPQYPTHPIYDVIIIGAGLSGLQCAQSLIQQHQISPHKILILEAQDYIGGRVKQMTEFIQGTKIEVGAEFLHGNNTELTKFARQEKEPLREIFCWAHGDGGPLEQDVQGGYGLYYIGNVQQPILSEANIQMKSKKKVKKRLLRYDDLDDDFVTLNHTLWQLANMHEDSVDFQLSLADYLESKKISFPMQKLAEAGFANTLCASSKELSLKQTVKWSRIWHKEGIIENINIPNFLILKIFFIFFFFVLFLLYI
jgi:cytochrome b involved in lipid metabolism